MESVLQNTEITYSMVCQQSQNRTADLFAAALRVPWFKVSFAFPGDTTDGAEVCWIGSESWTAQRSD